MDGNGDDVDDYDNNDYRWQWLVMMMMTMDDDCECSGWRRDRLDAKLNRESFQNYGLSLNYAILFIIQIFC